MRAVETRGDEERLVLVLLKKPDRFRGDDAIRLLLVRALGPLETQRAAQPALRGVIREQVLLVLVTTLWIDALRPRRLIVEPVRADLAGVPVVVDFPDPRRVIAVVFE